MHRCVSWLIWKWVEKFSPFLHIPWNPYSPISLYIFHIFHITLIVPVFHNSHTFPISAPYPLFLYVLYFSYISNTWVSFFIISLLVSMHILNFSYFPYIFHIPYFPIYLFSGYSLFSWYSLYSHIPYGTIQGHKGIYKSSKSCKSFKRI